MLQFSKWNLPTCIKEDTALQLKIVPEGTHTDTIGNTSNNSSNHF